MSERRDDPNDDEFTTHAAAYERDALSASARAALVDWADRVVPPLAVDFTDAVMLEVIAHDRACAWEAAFVPALPEDFARSITESAVAASDAQRAMTAWQEAMVPALPEDFAQSVCAAAVDAEVRDESVRAAVMTGWAEAYVPALPDDFAQSVTDLAMRGVEEAPRTSGVVEKVVPLAPKGVGAKRRWLAPAAVSSFAAAAVALLALSGGPKPSIRAPHTVVPGHSNNNAAQSNNSAANHGNTAAQPTTNPTVNAPTPDEGSEVEKVEVDGDRASFTAFSLAGEDDHSTVAVVWIDDGTKGASAL
jgi:hypothetical protein